MKNQNQIKKLEKENLILKFENDFLFIILKNLIIEVMKK